MGNLARRAVPRFQTVPEFRERSTIVIFSSRLHAVFTLLSPWHRLNFIPFSRRFHMVFHGDLHRGLALHQEERHDGGHWQVSDSPTPTSGATLSPGLSKLCPRVRPNSAPGSAHTPLSLRFSLRFHGDFHDGIHGFYRFCLCLRAKSANLAASVTVTAAPRCRSETRLNGRRGALTAICRRPRLQAPRWTYEPQGACERVQNRLRCFHPGSRVGIDVCAGGRVASRSNSVGAQQVPSLRPKAAPERISGPQGRDQERSQADQL